MSNKKALFKFDVLFSEIKGLTLNSTQEVYVVAEAMDEALTTLTSEYKDDTIRINNSQQVKGTIIVKDKK